MEFYFSDANLAKDRFIKQQTVQSSDGYLDLEMFLKFNKIRALTSDVGTIARALKKSEQLQMNADLTKVRRVHEFSPPQNVDQRTIYVECLPSDVNHEWVRKAFSDCGKVLYVSLPKYKSTGDFKGFAFVEFDTPQAAAKACETMNNPPSTAPERPGIFPRGSKAEKHLEKQVVFRQSNKPGRKRRASESMLEDSTTENAEVKKGHKRKRTKSVGTDDEAGENRKQERDQQSKACNIALTEEPDAGVKIDEGSEALEGDSDKTATAKIRTTKDELSHMKTDAPETKRSKRNSADKRTAREATRMELDSCDSGMKVEMKEEKENGATEKEDFKDQVEEAVVLKDDENLTAVSLKKKKKKRKHKDMSADRGKTEESEKDLSNKEAKVADENSPRMVMGDKVKSFKLKRRVSFDGAEEFESRKRQCKEDKAKTKKVVGDDTTSEEAAEKMELIETTERGENEKKKKEKKKRIKKAKESKESGLKKAHPALRVISKSDWLVRRAEYLALQKANMAQLKETLKQLNGPPRGPDRAGERARRDTGRVDHQRAGRTMEWPDKPSGPGLAGDNVGVKVKSGSLEFTPGVIVRLCSDAPLTCKEIKEKFVEFGEIAYVDVIDGDSTAHVRCANVGTAEKLSSTAVPGYKIVLLKGNEEEAYWNKMAADRERRLNKNRTKRKGKAKVLLRADRCEENENAAKKKHIVFN